MSKLDSISLYEVCGKETAKKYFSQTFQLSEDAQELIDSILDFIASEIYEDKHELLRKLLGNIECLDLSDVEIGKIADALRWDEEKDQS